MSQSDSGYYRKEKWYNRNIFPLIPVLETKRGDEHNTPGFTFRWLVFTFWTRDAFDFEIAFTISTHWGIGLTFLLPYLRGVICIPYPCKLGMWIDRKLSRRPKTEQSDINQI